jgi:nucleotide-binding universal stress UspA family protein
LQGVAQRWAAPDLPLHWEVLIAEHIAEQIVMRAHTGDVAMIAMTTHGRSGWSEWAFGSIAQKVLHGAPVPLLLRRARTAPAVSATPALRTILVPLDGSAFAEQALPLAQQFAQASNVTLLLVAAMPPLDDMGLVLAGVEPMWMLADSYATDDREKDYLNNIAQRVRATGITVHTCCVWDAPAQAILRTSTEEGADLVVMTTHGRMGVQRLWLGSVWPQGAARRRRPGAARARTHSVN